MRQISLYLILILLVSCAPAPAPVVEASPTFELPTSTLEPSPTSAPTETPIPSATPKPLVPEFKHVVVIVFENVEAGFVIGNTAQMPVFNKWAREYTLLSQFYAATHPSLPNYLTMIGGDTFGVTRNCNDCFVTAISLPDLIEQSGRTWKTYQEDMPKPCFLGDTHIYVQKHNPFIYFDPIRMDTARCERSIVPLTQLDADLAANALPNYSFITPNLCNSAHDCDIDVADAWLSPLVDKLFAHLENSGEPYLIVFTWDEGDGEHGCCGLGLPAGGRIATVLISPQAKNGFVDETPYTHYSLLKTILESWHLPYIGHAADENNVLIIAPWK